MKSQLELTSEEKRVLLKEIKILKLKMIMSSDYCKSLEKKDNKHILALDHKVDVLNSIIRKLG